MNLFDIITSSLSPSASTAKGSIVTVSKDGTKVYDRIGSPSTVLETYNKGKILGVVQEVTKAQVIKGGVLTKDFFLVVRVKLSEPIRVITKVKTYTDVWVVAENLEVFAEANAPVNTTSSVPAATANEVVLYSTGTGVRVRSTAAVVGGINDLGNNIITSYNKGDLIGVSDKKITNGFYKVKFPTTQTKKSDGTKHDFGYVSISYCSSTEPVKTTPAKTTKSSGQSPIQSDSTKTVSESNAKDIPSDSSSNGGFYRNRYGIALAGVAILGLLGVVIWAVNKLSKSKKTNGTNIIIPSK